LIGPKVLVVVFIGPHVAAVPPHASGRTKSHDVLGPAVVVVSGLHQHALDVFLYCNIVCDAGTSDRQGRGHGPIRQHRVNSKECFFTSVSLSIYIYIYMLCLVGEFFLRKISHAILEGVFEY
jgi:hypothetical protein